MVGAADIDHDVPMTPFRRALPSIVFLVAIVVLIAGFAVWMKVGSTTATMTCEIISDPRPEGARRGLSYKMETSCGDLGLDADEWITISLAVEPGDTRDFVVETTPFGHRHVVELLP